MVLKQEEKKVEIIIIATFKAGEDKSSIFKEKKKEIKLINLISRKSCKIISIQLGEKYT